VLVLDGAYAVIPELMQIQFYQPNPICSIHKMDLVARRNNLPYTPTIHISGAC